MAYSNLGINLLTTGSEAGNWGNITNDNFNLFDSAIVGAATLTLTTTSTTDLNVADGTASTGRNRIVTIFSAGDIGGTGNVRITPADFVGYYFIRNSLASNRSVIISQGTGATTVTVENGKDVIVRCDGANNVSLVLANPAFTSVKTDTLAVSGQVTNALSMGGNKITNLGTPTAGTDAATKTYVDSSGSITFATGNQILFRGATTPSGWTIVAQNNKALRIVSGTPSSGGASTFTSVFGPSEVTGSTVLTLSQIPAHTHNYDRAYGIAGNTIGGDNSDIQFAYASTASSSAGGGGGHTHTLSLDLAYYDMNIIQKS